MKEPKSINLNSKIKFSFIIAIYERENELQELLESISLQTSHNFEVLVVDDGSKSNLQKITDSFKDKIAISYFYKENQGASLARNFGANYAQGEYLLFVDSDCILPKIYIENIETYLAQKKVYFFGGPDDARQDFNITQKALSYAMTGFFTTGGIRGGKKNKNFQPRSFNMGILKNIFIEENGFKNIKIGEDVDLSLRLAAKGFNAELILNATVFHKRRINLLSFVKRVYSFGFMRPILIKWHPLSSRLVFYFPTFFLLGSVFLLAVAFINYLALLPLLLWSLCVLIESTIKYKNIIVSILSLFTSFIQLYAYGFGFLRSFSIINIFGNKPA